MTSAINRSLQNINGMVGRLSTMELSEPQKDFARRYIRTHMTTLSEALLSRPNDIAAGGVGHENMMTLVKETSRLFNISGSPAPSEELVKRTRNKPNVRDFAYFVEGI